MHGKGLLIRLPQRKIRCCRCYLRKVMIAFVSWRTHMRRFALAVRSGGEPRKPSGSNTSACGGAFFIYTRALTQTSGLGIFAQPPATTAACAPCTHKAHIQVSMLESCQLCCLGAGR